MLAFMSLTVCFHFRRLTLL